MILDTQTSFGARVARRLEQEQVIWLTTVDARSTPQPRPVWFIWEKDTFLIYSQPTAAKVRHIARNPRVALHFNSDRAGNDVIVFLGQARIDRGASPAPRVRAYVEKYRTAIVDLEMTQKAFAAEYSVAIRVTPETVRGF